MALGNDITILKLILENDLTLDYKDMTITKLIEKTNLSQDKVFKSVQKLSTLRHGKRSS